MTFNFTPSESLLEALQASFDDEILTSLSDAGSNYIRARIREGEARRRWRETVFGFKVPETSEEEKYQEVHHEF
jgi:hypothetical protein